MSRKTITLKGDAARAFILMKTGHKPQTEGDALDMIATRIHMEVHAGNMRGAIAILRSAIEHGVHRTCSAIGIQTAVDPEPVPKASRKKRSG